MKLEERLSKLEEKVDKLTTTLSDLYTVRIEPVQSWGEGVKTKKLKCGLEIALEDYYEIDEEGNKKIEFTYNEAAEIKKKTNGKWRVPTMVEWAQICDELGVKNNEVDKGALVKALQLTVNEMGYGSYWSRTAYSAQNGYALNVNTTGVNPANLSNKYYGFAVRCVKGGGDE